MKYIRLPGSRHGLFSKSTLWLADDHLLVVEFNGYTESYKHFPYKDIQALIARKTSRHKVWSIVLAVCATLPLGSFMRVLLNPHAQATFWTFLAAAVSALCLAFLAVNLFRGPTCVCHLQTSLGLHELPSLRHLRHFRSALAKLRPLVASFQGPAPDLRSGTQAAARVRTRKDTPFRAPIGPAEKADGYGGRIHLALYGLLLLSAALSSYTYWHANIPVIVLNALLTLAVLFLAFMAMYRERRFKVPATMKVLSRVVVIAVIVQRLFEYFFSLAYSIVLKRPDLIQDQYAMFRTMIELRPAQNAFLSVASLSGIIVLSVCGLMGLAAFHAWRRKTSSSSAVPTGTSTSSRRE
ncbi:MAG: hypothetical protein ABFD98_09075 [Syntrophobacteraceae bacterium]